MRGSSRRADARWVAECYREEGSFRSGHGRSPSELDCLIRRNCVTPDVNGVPLKCVPAHAAGMYSRDVSRDGRDEAAA